MGPAAFVGTGILAVVYLGLVFPMRYGITDTELVVRSGLVRRRIRLADITSVTPTRMVRTSSTRAWACNAPAPCSMRWSRD